MGERFTNARSISTVSLRFYPPKKARSQFSNFNRSEQSTINPAYMKLRARLDYCQQRVRVHPRPVSTPTRCLTLFPAPVQPILSHVQGCRREKRRVEVPAPGARLRDAPEAWLRPSSVHIWGFKERAFSFFYDFENRHANCFSRH